MITDNPLSRSTTTAHAEAADSGTPCQFVINKCRREGYQWRGQFHWVEGVDKFFTANRVDYVVDPERPRV